MAQYGQADITLVLVDGYNLATYLRELENNAEAITEETDTFGDSWIENSGVGVKQLALSMGGFFDDTAATGPHVALISSLGGDRIAMIGVEGNTLAKRVWGFAGVVESAYRRIARRREKTKFAVDWMGSGQVDELIILHPLQTRTTSTNSDATSFDSTTVTSSAGGVFMVEITALNLDGGSQVAIRWRDSADNISFAAIAGFGPNATAAPSASRTSSTSATVRRYWSTSWTFTGGGAGISVTFVAAAKRN